jgi:hypothetical protein
MTASAGPCRTEVTEEGDESMTNEGVGLIREGQCEEGVKTVCHGEKTFVRARAHP